MSKELVEKIAKIEDIPKKQVIEVIKTSKIEHDLAEQKTTISIQNIVKDNASEIIEKIDSKIPTYVQSYSDLYKKYLHIASNFYTASYLAQKEIFDKIGMEDTRFVLFDTYLESVKKMTLLQIDITENMFQSHVGHRLMVLDWYDQMMNWSITNFAKMSSWFNDNKK